MNPMIVHLGALGISLCLQNDPRPAINEFAVNKEQENTKYIKRVVPMCSLL